MSNLLFVCSQARNRSRTAAELAENAKYAGIFSRKKPVTSGLLKWADEIYVFEEIQLRYLLENFPSLVSEEEIINLKIPDRYRYNQPELKELLKEKVGHL